MNIQDKVMVVDDDNVVLQMVTVALEARGYVVVARDTPIGTGATILNERPEVAILDVEMPGLRGDKLLHLLRKNRSGFPMPWVIFHSARSQEELDSMVRQTGAAGAIVKSDVKSFLVAFEALLSDLRQKKRT